MYGIEEYQEQKFKKMRTVQKIPGKILPVNYFSG